MDNEVIKMMREIFNERIDGASSVDVYIAWTTARDVVEYAMANNIDCLKEFRWRGEEE